MREVNRHAIVAYPVEAMFDLVADVNAYPEFLPGCVAADILEERDDEVVARLSLAQGPLQFGFTTRNVLRRPDSMSLALVDGPFRNLQGQWAFQSLGEGGSRLRLSLEFEFTSRVKDFAMGLVFEQTCNQLVDAFVKRANELYGDP